MIKNSKIDDFRAKPLVNSIFYFKKKLITGNIRNDANRTFQVCRVSQPCCTAYFLILYRALLSQFSKRIFLFTCKNMFNGQRLSRTQ